MTESARYTLGEEIANSSTHAVGLLLSIFGLVVLIDKAGSSNDVWRLTSGIVFGVSLILLYASSAAYHGFRGARIKSVLQIVDLNSSPSADAPNDPFRVETWLPNDASTSLVRRQPVSAAAGPAQILVATAQPTVGRLVTNFVPGGQEGED